MALVAWQESRSGAIVSLPAILSLHQPFTYSKSNSHSIAWSDTMAMVCVSMLEQIYPTGLSCIDLAMLFFPRLAATLFGHFFQSLLPTRNLHRLLFIFHNFLTDFVFINHFANQEHLPKGDQVGKHIVIAQA